MALKEKRITIEKGRDAGTTFLIREMPIAKADKWAMRALMAMAGAGIAIPNVTDGMMGIARVALGALQSIPEDKAISLMDELLECVQIIPEGGHPRQLDLSINDVQDFTSLWLLRKEALMLHIDFLQSALTPISE